MTPIFGRLFKSSLIPFNSKISNIKRFYGAAEDLSTNQPLLFRKNTCLSVSECRSGVDIISDDSVKNVNLSYHGRSLPDHLKSLESLEGQELFRESYEKGHACNFFPLITNFASQSDVSMCGPASLAMVLNALKLDPMRIWRRPWRWWSDEMFACCDGSLEVMRRSGVTLEFFDRIAKTQPGITVETRNASCIKEFRDSLIKSTTEKNNHVIVSFSRESLGQTGIGHFSPIAALHPEKDSVLILDVARFKYPPYWVKIEKLYEAMKGIDSETKKPRGYSIIKRNEEI